MANREALRELQSRLALRLQQARTEVRQQAWLALQCAGADLLVPLSTAGEIFPVSRLLPLPHTQGWFLGVANLRGAVHGVVDLGAFLGLRPPVAVDALREQARLLALNARHGAHCALLIDRLAGLRRADQLTPEADDGVERPAFAGGRWRDENGRIWQEIDLAALARDDQFLTIAAADASH